MLIFFTEYHEDPLIIGIGNLIKNGMDPLRKNTHKHYLHWIWMLRLE